LITASNTKASPAKAKTTKAKAAKGGKGDVVAHIRNYLCEMHNLGFETVSEDQLLHEIGYARADSTGFRKASKELIKELGHVEKVDGKNYKLTEEGKKHANPSETPKMMSNKDVEEQKKAQIIKLSKGKVPAAKLDAIWAVLGDGEAHTTDELLQATGYKCTDSTGYRVIMKWLKNLELIEKDSGSFKFVAEKVFPFAN